MAQWGWWTAQKQHHSVKTNKDIHTPYCDFSMLYYAFH